MSRQERPHAWFLAELALLAGNFVHGLLGFSHSEVHQCSLYILPVLPSLSLIPEAKTSHPLQHWWPWLPLAPGAVSPSCNSSVLGKGQRGYQSGSESVEEWSGKGGGDTEEDTRDMGDAQEGCSILSLNNFM